jgi:primase-polymerase (primpol)-like protein
MMPPVKDSACSSNPKNTDTDPVVSEAPIVPEEVQVERPHRFITIPNIKSYKQAQPAQQTKQDRYNRQLLEAKIVPRVKSVPPIDKIKIDKFVPSKKQQLQDQHHQQNHVSQDPNVQPRNSENAEKRAAAKASDSSIGEPEKSKTVHLQTSGIVLQETELEKVDVISDSDRSRSTKTIAVDEKDMIDKCEGKLLSFLTILSPRRALFHNQKH